MDMQHNSIPESAFNAEGLRALTYVIGHLKPGGEIPSSFQGTLNVFACDLWDKAMEIPSACRDDLRWKFENFAADIAAHDPAEGSKGLADWRRWADLLRADILRLIGTEQVGSETAQ